jgi:hypothetical protein
MAQRKSPPVWGTYQVAMKTKDAGRIETPFFEQLSVGGKSAVQPINKMQLIQTLGWEEARRTLKDDKGRKVIVKKDDLIWLVKCKPSCWRLYCYVYENGETHQIIYVHAVCKKKDDEDPGDLTTARRIADDIGSRARSIAAFEFPSG